MSTPRDVVLAALAIDLAGADRPDVEARADVIVAALVDHGHLPDPRQPPPIEDVARALAEASLHPRYSTGDGWRRILQSPADVNVAATAAARAAGEGRAQEIAQYRTVLLMWHNAVGTPR